MTLTTREQRWKREVEETDRVLLETQAKLAEAEAEIARLRNPLAFNPPDQDVFVVITEASKTEGSHAVKHAWGPYTSRNKAQASAQRFKRNAQEEGHVTKTSVLKIISS